MFDPTAQWIHSHGADRRRPVLERPAALIEMRGRAGVVQELGLAGSHLMLLAWAARAAPARSQSGAMVRRTRELCASHSAVQDEQLSRYEPPEYDSISSGVPS